MLAWVRSPLNYAERTGLPNYSIGGQMAKISGAKTHRLSAGIRPREPDIFLSSMFLPDSLELVAQQKFKAGGGSVGFGKVVAFKGGHGVRAIVGGKKAAGVVVTALTNASER